ncbi:MAG: peptidase M14, partial [Armatimonadetes bacterium]|nr:peptidase M14 [Armatimonadota bacterium]
MMRRIAAVGLLGLALLAGTSLAADSPGLMTPEQFLGFRVGTDRKLARWDQVLTYLRRAAQASPRIRYEELGKSTLGNSFPMLAISSPQNLSRLKEIQAAQRKLAYPYALEDREADALIRRNPLVVLITCTIHSSEIASTQMCLELVHELATDTSPRIREMLDRIVFLLVPSLNPDGQVLVVDWYQKNVGTPYEYASIPFLYHPYTGHDDNRDAYMLTQIESRLITRVLYKDWFPIVYLDEHQMGSSGPRIFVPPFEDPINPNQDPLVIATSSQIGMHLFTALNEAGLPGAVYGERFTWWWQGS